MPSDVDRYYRIHQVSIARKRTEMKILIVDDSQNGALALQMQLVGNGYERVFIEYSAQGAFDFLKKQPPKDPCRLILMDICMPDMDGIEATRWLKKQSEFRDIPVVMVSGDDDIERLSQAFRAGALDFIRKSSEETELIARVESVLRLQREMEHRITHEKELKLLTEKFKKKAYEAEMANRSKSQFLANMSHEIRTPMNGIIGMASLALANNKSSVVENYLKSVQSSAQVLLNLLNDILDLSSIESEKMNMEHLEFDIREVVEQSVTLFAKKAYEKEIELILFFDNSIPEKAIGDPYRLSQILNNLISNAIKFTSEGAITVSVHLLKQSQRNLQLKYAVQDTGVGIDSRHHNKIFEVFTQADSSTTRQFGGTGLGLTISKKLVEKMNGEIWIESQLGRGSTFIFTPQFLLPSKQAEEKIWFPSDYFSNVKAIVFDNNSTAAEAAVASLLAIGIKAVHILDEKKLFQLLTNQESFDLLLINNFLDSSDGLKLAQEIRTNPAFFQPKIVLMCGLGIDVPNELIQRSGIDAIVSKPITYQNLANAIVKAFKPDLQDNTVSNRSPDIIQYKNIRALLAEDNDINIDVALGILKMANVNKVDIAKNGLDAVEKIKKSFQTNQAFDFVLMDIQMPEMDGLEATQIIRTFESSFLSMTDQTKHRIPIIAMTAYAMNGDKENFIGAGMDDYIAKPLNAEKLIEKIDKWIVSKRKDSNNAIESEMVSKDQAGAKDQDILDMDEAVKRLFGNKELYLKILKRFLEEHEHVDQTIKEALDQKNFETAHLLSHTIKGVASNLSAKPLRKSALDLEKSIKNQADEDVIYALYNSFQIEIRRMIDLTKALVYPESERERPDTNNNAAQKTLQTETSPKIDKTPPDTPERETPDNTNSDLLEISEINAQAAINRLSGNVNLFVNVLKRFYHDYQGFTSRIRDAFLKKNLDKLKEEAHTLKSVAGYLEAAALLDAAKNLEIYVTEKRYEQIQNVIYTIEDIITRIFKSIRRIIQNETIDDNTEPLPQLPKAIRNKFAVLNKLLTESDSEIKDMIQDFENALNQMSISLSARRYLKKMVREINSYQFDNAQKSLLSLAESFKLKIEDDEVTQ
jgi:signal transduction histidine kinase/HPt (histidine-containing phosphotransfer) domain-containing protein